MGQCNCEEQTASNPPPYSGATQVVWDSTDPPGNLRHDSTFCSIECVSVKYEVPAVRQDIVRFYERWSRDNGWLPWGNNLNSGPGFSGLSYQYGPTQFTEWRFDPEFVGFPWFEQRHEMRRDFILEIQVRDGQQGTGKVDLLLHRVAPMASDTPVPTLPPPPPTAPIPRIPGDIRTQMPSNPIPVPTR